MSKQAGGRWSVWSRIPDHNRWLEVAEDLTQREAEEAVQRKLAAAAKFGIPDAQFVALPAGQQP